MEKLKNRYKKGIRTKRKIGKVAYDVVAHFNEKAPEIMQDELKGYCLGNFREK